MTAKTAEDIPWESRRQAAVVVKAGTRTLVAYSEGPSGSGSTRRAVTCERDRSTWVLFLFVRFNMLIWTATESPRYWRSDTGETVEQRMSAGDLDQDRSGAVDAEPWMRSTTRGASCALPDRPWVVDLDGDGRFEIVVPDSGPMPPLRDIGACG